MSMAIHAMSKESRNADKYRLKVIYDAAHCFGVKYKGVGICNYGDLSILSFHATKVFNTMEGGAIICHDQSSKKHIDYLKNFGFASETEVLELGINSKMNEMQASLGLLQLKYYHENVKKRKIITEIYRVSLQGVKGISFLTEPLDTISNYAYFPIYIDEKEYGMSRDELYEKLKKQNIYGRRYFYPLISEFPIYRGLDSARQSNLPTALDRSGKVICLPLYSDLKVDVVSNICEIISN